MVRSDHPYPFANLQDEQILRPPHRLALLEATSLILTKLLI